MTESLRRLLQQPIDYAGLFPPAKLDMQAALCEYKAVMESDDAWIVNRFVIAGSQLEKGAEVWMALRDDLDDRVPATVIGRALSIGETAPASLQAEQALIEAQLTRFDVSGFEVRLPLGNELAGCAGALKKHHHWFADREIDVFVELPLGEGLSEAMAEVASRIDGVGFKARTGGVKADQFPSVGQVAEFIAEVAGLEAPFKFTAGLHEPVRYYDSELACYHHGFLNVLVASALAMIQHATVSEIEQVLSVEDGGQFKFTDQTVDILGSSLSLKDLDEWWLYFRGYGACVYDEQIDGLKRLRLI
ncbi:MAG: hypothetical protein IIC73_05200 [Armatimonadetes bacterium]|nr:hypothetical protein [Armatimonadota bacterium]